MKCKHPPNRLFCWTAYDGTVCCGCCECGKILSGGYRKPLKWKRRYRVTLPDGYNGDTVECYRKPISIENNVAKLRVVNSYLIRYVSVSDLEKL